jgi:MFS transporter, DHA1 family, multidrug resistance protein
VAWTGAVFAAAYVLQIVTFPVWGALADRRSRRLLVTLALTSAGVVFLVLALAQHAWQVFGLRSLQATVGAPSVATLALLSSLLPAARLTTGLGVLQTMSFVGQSMGPLLGSLAATRFGLRAAFVVAAIGLLVTGALVAVLVRESPRPGHEPVAQPPFFQRLRIGLREPVLRATLLSMLGYQLAYSVSWVLLPVHISSSVGAGDAPTAIGIVLLANSVGIAVGATALGWVAGHAGAHRVAVLALVAAGVLTAPQVWANDTTSFALTRFALGLCAGGVLPLLRAALAATDGGLKANSKLVMVYGLAQSATAAGFALGAPIGSIISLALGLPWIHAASGALMVLVGAWYAYAVRSVAV